MLGWSAFKKGMNMGIVKTSRLIFEYIRRNEEGDVEGMTDNHQAFCPSHLGEALRTPSDFAQCT